MRVMNRQVLRWSPMRWFGTVTPYEPDLISQIKGLRPCSWDAMSKTWWFPESLLPHVHGLLVNYMGADVVPDLSKVTDPRSHQRPTWVSGDPYAVMGLREDACDRVVHAAWDALKHEWMPERSIGGSDEPLRRSRAAYEEICALRRLTPRPA